MKRLIVAAIFAASLLAFVSPAQAAGSYRQPVDGLCKYQLYDGHKGWSVKEVKKTIICAERRWPVPKGLDYAMAIADRESGYHQFAYNPSGCSGVYQWAKGTWSSVLDDFPTLYKVLGHNVFNARSNVMYAIKYAHNRGWGPWGG